MVEFSEREKRTQSLESEEPDQGPYVCPGCYAIGGEPCAPGCIDHQIEQEREEDRDAGRYEDEEDNECPEE